MERKRARRQRALFCPRVLAIVTEVHNAVHGHRGGTRRHHGDNNPDELAQRRPALRRLVRSPSREQRARQRKRKRKNGVLELDHFEYGADAASHASYASAFFTLAWPVQRYIFSC